MRKSDAYRRVRKICMAMPEAAEKPFGGHTSPAFRVRDTIFVFCYQEGRTGISLKGAPGAQQALVGSAPSDSSSRRTAARRDGSAPTSTSTTSIGTRSPSSSKRATG